MFGERRIDLLSRMNRSKVFPIVVRTCLTQRKHVLSVRREREGQRARWWPPVTSLRFQLQTHSHRRILSRSSRHSSSPSIAGVRVPCKRYELICTSFYLSASWSSVLLIWLIPVSVLGLKSDCLKDSVVNFLSPSKHNLGSALKWANTASFHICIMF